MTQKVRRMIRLPATHDERLKRLAEEAGIDVSELVRRIVDSHIRYADTPIVLPVGQPYSEIIARRLKQSQQ